jgi:hypothetical protein
MSDCEQENAKLRHEIRLAIIDDLLGRQGELFEQTLDLLNAQAQRTALQRQLIAYTHFQPQQQRTYGLDKTPTTR